jgi:hypothetical protein
MKNARMTSRKDDNEVSIFITILKINCMQLYFFHFTKTTQDSDNNNCSQLLFDPIETQLMKKRKIVRRKENREEIASIAHRYGEQCHHTIQPSIGQLCHHCNARLLEGEQSTTRQHPCCGSFKGNLPHMPTILPEAE